MLTVIGIVLFALGLLVSIALHEVGHLVPAKRSGVKVTQYMVGFGPTLWSRRRGETEYGLKWIPLGGYIRMIGMFPPAPGEDPRRLRRGSTGPFSQLIEDARRVSLEEVKPGDEDRVFYKLPVRRKLVIMLGGPTMNLLIAVVLFGIAMSGLGAAVATSRVDVSPCVLPAAAERGCEPTDPQSPAAAAGLRDGDRIVAFDGRPVERYEQLIPLIRDAGDRRVPVVVERDGGRVELAADVRREERPSLTDARQVERVGFLGVGPTSETTVVREPVTAVPGRMWELTSRTAVAVVTIPQRMVGVWDAAFGDAQRDPNGPVGVVGATRLGGEFAALEDVPLRNKVAGFVGLLASVNLALFVFNLLPLLPLDGGHVAGALWEGARRQLARLRRRPDPGFVDVARLLPLAYGVAVLLIGMSVLVLYADIVNPVTLR